MIKDIKELNLPIYASLTQATCTLQDMAEKTITAQIKIDGGITPDFSYDWELEFKGEKYIMPLRKPQASKENTSLNSVIDLTFQHWAQYQLKRWFFFTIQPIESGTAIPDKYEASVSLSLGDFCDLFSQVLEYYYGDAITIDLNPAWQYSSEPTGVEISRSFLWDVLIKLYDLYAVRWQIVPNGDTEHYTIKVGYPTTELSHIFEYGFEGGLLKVERQVQSEDIRNMLIGRGGEKNLPYRYFKDVDPQNPTFPADPDWIPELKDIYFSELHGATFRSYVQGWNHRHYLRTKVTSADKAYAPWAWTRGYTDERFNPIEFVADEFNTEADGRGVVAGSSIDRYGELMDGLENNEDIYPSIQGVVIDPYGRIDEAVAVEPIESDDIVESVESDAQVRTCDPLSAFKTIGSKKRETATVLGAKFEVPKGMHADYDEGVKNIYLTRDVIQRHWVYKNRLTLETTTIQVPVDDSSQVLIEDAYISIINADTGEEHSASGIPEGWYYPKISFSIYNESDSALNVTVECAEPKLVMATLGNQWSNTWRVWIKNVWNTKKWTDESDTEYATRVWGPILGDRTGEEAKVVFADGMLSMSEDYEFVITAIPTYDKKECSWETVENGEIVTHTFESEWCLVLGKNDADLESTGLYVPSTKRQAKAGDHFFFIGIDMPHQYVLWAEERLDNYKTDQLHEVSDIKPTWVVSLDKVRIANEGRENALIDQLYPGCSLRLADKRFILNELGEASAYEMLYLQSITYTYNEPSSNSPALIPDVEVVLSDKYATTANPVATITGEVAALAKQVGSISNVEQIVRAVGDKLYLRKDGMPDRSMSPTEYASLLTSLGFRPGITGGTGWGFFKDENGNWVLETDRLNVRQEMQVNNLVINQITARGGMIIESAAQLEIARVVETSDGYICYFDQKQGTIANLFNVDDVAYCNRFTAENEELKFYKRRVIAVADDCLTLTKGYTAVTMPDGTQDTGVNGSGVPTEGDVIVHYGNYTDATRRYVKVRDVISGGYERYIEGLDSVNAAGTEYYFVGRQAGMYEGRPRWFVGDPQSNIEYRDGKFSLNNVRLSVTSTIGDESIDNYILNNLGFGITNMLLDSDKEALVKSVPTASEAVYDLSEPLTIGETYTISIWGSPADIDGVIFLFVKIGGKIAITNKRLTKIRDGYWTLTIEAEDNYDAIGFFSRGNLGLVINKAKLERGKISSDWSPAPADVKDRTGYLQKALKESTTIAGGLVVASLLQLGYSVEDSFVIKSGVNGIYDEEKPGGGIAFWAGGSMIDAADNPSGETAEEAATSMVRMDGTGYLADNTIRFDRNKLELGDNLSIESNELKMITDDKRLGLVVRSSPTGFGSDKGFESNHTSAITRNIAVENATYAPTSQSFYLATIFKETYSLGQWASGTTIRIVVDSYLEYLSNAYTPLATNAGVISVVLINTATDERTEVGQTSWGAPKATATGSYAYRYPIKIDMQTTLAVGGSYVLEISSSNPYEQQGWPGGITKSSMTLKTTYTIDGTESRMFVIGSDGIAANWGKSLFCVDENGMLLRFGNKYIRFSDMGIQINRGNGLETL